MSRWQIMQDGVPIGFYDSREEAVKALSYAKNGWIKVVSND